MAAQMVTASAIPSAIETEKSETTGKRTKAAAKRPSG
jgi:hypothetical protein